MDTIISIIGALPEILGGILMGLGALKIFARYTKSEADDKVLAAIEKPLKIAKELADKLRSSVPEKEKEEESDPSEDKDR